MRVVLLYTQAFLYLIVGLLAAMLVAAPVVVHQAHARTAFCEADTTLQRTSAQFLYNSEGSRGSRCGCGSPIEAGSVGCSECGPCKNEVCGGDCSDGLGELGGGRVKPGGMVDSVCGAHHPQNESKAEDAGQESSSWASHVSSMLRKGVQALASSPLWSVHNSTADGSSICRDGGSQGCHDGVQQSMPLPAWCSASPWWRPSVYGYVQEHYWGVGLFKYWKLQQVRPNALLFPWFSLFFASDQSS